MAISLKSIKDSLMQTQAVEVISEKAILATHVSTVRFESSEINILSGLLFITRQKNKYYNRYYLYCRLFAVYRHTKGD